MVKKERLKANRNFDSASDTEADKQRSRETNNLSKLEQKLAAAEKEAASKRPVPKPQHAHQQQQHQHQAMYKSPYNGTAKASTSKARTVLPKGTAGRAAQGVALAPQLFVKIAGVILLLLGSH